MERLTVRNSEGIGVLKQSFECERCGDLQWSLPDLGNGSPIDKLAEYEDSEEQGKLLKLPCKVGDWLYAVRFGDIELHRVNVIEIEKSGIYLKSERDRPFCELGSFGKTVFFCQGRSRSCIEKNWSIKNSRTGRKTEK